MITLTVKKFASNEFMVTIEGQRGKRGFGENVYDSIGDLVMNHQEDFGVQAVLVDQTQEQKGRASR